ncbi:MAG: hypothetical protein QM796_09560 [Chthoniobacteraceae bacterium]
MKAAIAHESKPMDEAFFSKLASQGIPYILQWLTQRNKDGAENTITTLCAHCQSELDDKGIWRMVKREPQISISRRGRFTHGICPDCTREYFPEVNLEEAAAN